MTFKYSIVVKHYSTTGCLGSFYALQRLYVFYRDSYTPLQHGGGTVGHWLLLHLECSALHGHKVSSRRVCSGSSFILRLVWGWDTSGLCSLPSQVWRHGSIWTSWTSSRWHISSKSLPESLKQESLSSWMYVRVSSLSPGGKYTRGGQMKSKHRAVNWSFLF